MSVESSTPEAAAALAERIADYVESSTVYDQWDKRRCAIEAARIALEDASHHTVEVLRQFFLDDLTDRGFTVVSGGEGLQHGVALTRDGPVFLGCGVSCDDDCDMQHYTEPVYRVASGAAPGTTAEPALEPDPVPMTEDEWRPFADHLGIDDRSAGTTAPETTPACPDCAGSKRGPWSPVYGSGPCPSCAGSGVAETTP